MEGFTQKDLVVGVHVIVDLVRLGGVLWLLLVLLLVTVVGGNGFSLHLLRLGLLVRLLLLLLKLDRGLVLLRLCLSSELLLLLLPFEVFLLQSQPLGLLEGLLLSEPLLLVRQLQPLRICEVWQDRRRHRLGLHQLLLGHVWGEFERIKQVLRAQVLHVERLRVGVQLLQLLEEGLDLADVRDERVELLLLLQDVAVGRLELVQVVYACVFARVGVHIALLAETVNDRNLLLLLVLQLLQQLLHFLAGLQIVEVLRVPHRLLRLCEGTLRAGKLLQRCLARLENLAVDLAVGLQEQLDLLDVVLERLVELVDLLVCG
uniref:Transmembrane domain-containing protein n=1 Tax=Spironucleus salmonicida TaxID=348837 RepID=V6LIP0_9EUKA|eukprot:EST44178.1 Transmembrane domain-containing protein [Spironucleus salmonicida]